MMTVKECIEQLAANNPNEWRHDWGETPRQAAVRLLLTLLPEHKPKFEHEPAPPGIKGIMRLMRNERAETMVPIDEVFEVWGRDVMEKVGGEYKVVDYEFRTEQDPQFPHMQHRFVRAGIEDSGVEL